MWCVVYVGMWGHNVVDFFSSKKQAQKYVQKCIKEKKPYNHTYFIAKIDSYSSKEDILLMTEE